MKDVEADTKGQVRYLGIYWTLGRYDTVVLFEAPNEKVAMNMAFKKSGPDGYRDSHGRTSRRR
jgi:uncharacterized protein with GYD domain